MPKRFHDRKTIETAGLMWFSGSPMSEVSRRLKVPYRTIVYWIKHLRKAGLPKPQKGRVTERNFKQMVREMKNIDMNV